MSIYLSSYDPLWPALFEAEAEKLAALLGPMATRIEHVGSTAVPGLAAKPVIDIQVSVPAGTPRGAVRSALEASGYTCTEQPFPYFHKPERWPHTHHVHVREADSPDEQRTLRFRDWLRSHAEARRAYEALKRELAEATDPYCPHSRFCYSDGKSEFVARIERCACGLEEWS